jgi:hypothetical protein
MPMGRAAASYVDKMEGSAACAWVVQALQGIVLPGDITGQNGQVGVVKKRRRAFLYTRLRVGLL